MDTSDFYDKTLEGTASTVALGNLTDVYEYEYGSAPAITGTCPASPPSNTHTRRTHADFASDDNYTNASNYPFLQGQIVPVRLRHLLTSVRIFDRADADYLAQNGTNNEVSLTTFTYDGGTKQATPSSSTALTWGTWSQPNGDKTGGSNRGNVTSITRRANYLPSVLDLSIQRKYDILGNVVEFTDPKGNTTTFDYTDNFEVNPPLQPAFAFVTKTTMPTANTGDPAFSATVSYDWYNGKPVGFKYANGITTSASYASDSMDRLKSITRGADSRSTQFTYDDTATAPAVSTTTDQYFALDAGRVSKVTYDGWGRPTTASTGPSSSAVSSRTTYDTLGRVDTQCNPTIAGGSNTDGCETYTYDLLGRRIGIRRADGSKVTLSYAGNTTTTTDERALTSQTSTVDALGRLTSVLDDMGNTTNYTYDALDNLVRVTQGTQTRTFTYDAIKRLLSVTQPETTAITYTYDGNGNLLTKTQATAGGAAGTTVTFTYDALNRVTAKKYSDSTPAAFFCYDGRKFDTDAKACGTGAPVLGQYLRSTGSSAWKLTGGVPAPGGLVAVSSYTFDSLGRVTANSATIPGAPGSPFSFSYIYNVDDSLQSITYPSLRNVTTCYDRLGRPVWASSGRGLSDCVVSGTGLKTVPSSATGYYGVVQSYFPTGQMDTLKLGNGLTESRIFDGRQQMKQLTLASVGAADCPSVMNLLRLTYDYNRAATKNNGNLASQQIESLAKDAGTGACSTVTTTQTYGYDTLNRLTSVQEAPGNTWTESFTYDRWGNIQATSPTAPLFMPTQTLQIDSAKNRVVRSTAAKTSNDVTYDDAGNLTAFPGMVSAATYDAENRLVSYTASGGGTATFTYDAEGRRISKMAGTSTYYVYDAGGNLAAEAGGAGDVAGTAYVTADHLGSTRAVTDAVGKILSRTDYMPFGETIPGSATYNRAQVYGYSGPRGTSMDFTGQVRDTETGLDYFGARYFSGGQGRFTTPDPVAINRQLQDPQLWNKYAYVGNRPLSYIDPDGKWPFWIHDSIINSAFGGILSRADRRVLQAASSYTDRQANQDAAHAYEHGMRGDPNQSPEAAAGDTRRFISDQIELAVQAQLAGENGHPGVVFNSVNGVQYASEYAYDSMFQLGQAIHAATDSFTPTHTGSQLWTGNETAGEIARHVWGESKPFSNEEAQYQARIEAQRVYQTYKKRLDEERKKRQEDQEQEQ